MVDFNPGSPRIRRAAPSSKAVAAYARFALLRDHEAKAVELALSIYWAVRKDVIPLLYAYPKNAAADLTPKQVLQLAKVVKEEFGK
jgi:hypothetical protein